MTGGSGREQEEEEPRGGGELKKSLGGGEEGREGGGGEGLGAEAGWENGLSWPIPLSSLIRRFLVAASR